MARLFSLIVASVIGLHAACMPTQQAYHVEKSGFLGDYSKLREGGKGEPLLYYRNPKVNVAAYDRALVEPVTIWREKDSNLEQIPERDLQHLALLLQVKIIQALKQEGYTIAHEPGPGVMRIRGAITEAAESSVEMDVVTTAVPVFVGKKLTTGTYSFVGTASVEGEVSDSETGEVLWAMVDRRAGGRTPEGVTNSWDDVEKAFEYWAYRLAYRLCRESGREHCVPP